MEVWILIGIMFLPGAIGYVIVSIQDWIEDVRFYKRRTQKELDRARRLRGKAECISDKVYVFNPSKTIILTGTVGYEQLEAMGATLNEAERLIKEAKEKKV